jgi:hypothetical protein
MSRHRALAGTSAVDQAGQALRIKGWGRPSWRAVSGFPTRGRWPRIETKLSSAVPGASEKHVGAHAEGAGQLAERAGFTRQLEVPTGEPVPPVVVPQMAGRSQARPAEPADPATLRALPGHPGVAGVLVDQDADLLFTSDREASQASVYRCSDEKLLARLEVGPHPNGLAFDRGRGRLFSFDLGEPVGANCTASVADVGRQQVVATITLPGRPRWAVYEPVTDQV